jgi:uncharacterized protein YggE
MDEEKINEYMKCCKNPVKILIGAVLAVLTIFIAAKAVNEIKNEGKTIQDVQNTITVSAEGKIYAKPDIGEINLGVTNEAKTVAEAQAKSTEAINKVMDFLKSSGVEEKDIRTTNYNIRPVYDYTEARGQTLRGYSVSQNLDVKIRDLAKSGNIIAGAATGGANVVGGLNFTIDDLDAIKAQARQEAINKARNKAKELTDELGIKLGKLVSFSESGGYPIYYDKSMALGVGGGETVPAPSIPTGENEITVDVSLTYKIK